MMAPLPFRLLAGPKALSHIREYGLRAQDIACLPAAAGGPKGLILNALDKYLFGTWLAAAPRRRELIGASIGAWRMACGAASDPVQAFDDLARCYIEEQRYTGKPDSREISRVARTLLEGVVLPRREAMLSHPHHRLQVLVNRGCGPLGPGSTAHKRGFAQAALANAVGRRRLAGYMERFVFHGDSGVAPIFETRFDAFANHKVRFSARNFDDAMVATGSIPLVLDAVKDIADAPPGWYWDGGIIDYHLHLPYDRIDPTAGGLTLYPHFSPSITPGWLDKFAPWRKAHKDTNRHWMDTLVIVCPSESFVASLPGGSIPDRKDFQRFGPNWQAREAKWKPAIAQAQALADAWHELAQRQAFTEMVEPLY
jgi:hypothetical protein